MIIFIEAPNNWQDRETVKVKNYGILRIISYIKSKGYPEGIECYDFSFNSADYDKAIEHAESLPYADVYAFSVMESNYLNSLKMAEMLKRRNKCTIVFGGSSATELGREILETHNFIDYVIYGANEGSFYKLLIKRPEEIPNLIWRRSEIVIKNPIEYPFPEWQTIMPVDIDWNSNGEYSQDKFIVSTSLGCIAKCDFCNIVVKEPKLYEREIKYVTEEIKQDILIAKKKGVDKIFVQIMHQNFLHRLDELMISLKNNNLLDNIHSIAFNSRADTFLAEQCQKTMIHTLEEYPFITFNVYIGIESYVQETLNEIGKIINVNKNIEATRRLIEFKHKYENFYYSLSFIGLCYNTTEEHIRRNIAEIRKLFENEAYPAHYLFYSPLRLGVTLAHKFRKERKKGHYMENNFFQPFEEGNFAYPKDIRMQHLLNKFYYHAAHLPDFTIRKKAYQDLNQRNLITFSKEEFFRYVHAEICILEALLDNKDPYEIISNVNNIFNTLLRHVQMELVKA